MDAGSSIAELYHVFQPYRLGSDFGGCSHCIDPKDTERLASIPLRDLTITDLEHYASDALTVWGEVRHFKFFLPRLFELALDDAEAFSSLEILFSKLAYGNWDSWPQSERHALNDYFHLFWAGILATDPSDDRVDTALCALGNANNTVRPFLDQWTDTDAGTAHRQFAHFVLLNTHDLANHKRLANAFWDGCQEQARQVIEWLNLPEVYEYLYDGRGDLDNHSMEAVPRLAEWQCT